MGKHPCEPSRWSHSNAEMEQQNNRSKTFISFMGIVYTILTSQVMGVHIPGQCWFGSQLNVYPLNKILLRQYPLTVVDDSAQYRRYKSCLPAGPTRFWSSRPNSKVAGLGPTGRRKNRTLFSSEVCSAIKHFFLMKLHGFEKIITMQVVTNMVWKEKWVGIFNFYNIP